MNSPKRYNALGATVLKELVQAAKWFDEQRDIRVIIVKGAGNVFSAGADLKDPIYANVEKVDWLTRREMGQLGLRMAKAIESMRAVTIAQVERFCIGGGLVLMMACDLRVAESGTVFSIPEVDLGIPLAWGGIPKMVREVGPAMTKELVMTCRRFTGQLQPYCSEVLTNLEAQHFSSTQIPIFVAGGLVTVFCRYWLSSGTSTVLVQW